MSISANDKNSGSVELNDLIEKMRSGEQAAFDEIFKRCAGHVAFVCSKFCHNKEDVEEIVQDTFLIAYRKAGDLKPETFLAYLRKIAVHLCYQKNKKNKHTADLLPNTDEYDAQSELDENLLPEEYLQNKEKRNEVLRIINSLPKKQREMTYLYYYADVNTEEIAQLLDCMPGNVRKTLHSARKTIKDKLVVSNYAPEKAYGVSLAAILLLEEQAFVAAYCEIALACAAGIGGVAASTTAAATTTVAAGATASSVVPAIVGCLVAASLVATGIYYTVFHTRNDDEYETSCPIHETEPPREDTGQVIETDPPPPPVETDPPEDTEPIPPEPVDRTAEIMSRLALTNTQSQLEAVIAYYSFTFAMQIRSSDDMQYRFYVVNEGSGDIMIGIAVSDDGDGWKMRFTHFSNGEMPRNILELLQFME